ncbi:hypothetical protein GCM10010495_70300 [Kitasatospora herbaricolor]|uniref:hypothetical protein n=1 Tax=Kitasatospora herbaricolor TaxID=68217 RepID=UPI00174A9B22|nr:hypothetical protein [Kitasatospora herbaricolor]MDQ0306258.1 hypothetical protein [Kitasatospora herbaricolor]GGV42732.1 hypothetical protein GCM10010495_70300 [Kitasatospora herbaricolor]
MTSQSAATLRSRYVAQATSDLEENRRRQQDLAEELKSLRQEEALLIDIMTLAEHYQDGAEPSPLPEQAQAEPVPVRPRRRAKSAPGAAAARTGTARAGRKGKAQQPLLGDILLELLAGYGEPQLAKDLRDELMAKYPAREPTPQVVRNTLESLVAKGRVRRHKEERSVMYTLDGGAHGAAAGGTAG